MSDNWVVQNLENALETWTGDRTSENPGGHTLSA